MYENYIAKQESEEACRIWNYRIIVCNDFRDRFWNFFDNVQCTCCRGSNGYFFRRFRRKDIFRALGEPCQC